MSTDYCLLQNVLARDLFDGRLEEFGVREHFNDETTEQSRMLSDGRNYLWLYVDDAGLVRSLTRYMPNGVPTKILSAIAEAFDAEIVSEYEPQFWGFDTQEEWDAWELMIDKQYQDKFYNDVLKYLQGEPHGIPPGTNGMLKAKIAKKLVESDATFLEPANKEKFQAQIESIFQRDHMLSQKSSPQALAAAKLGTTHEDDLPRA